MTNSNALTVPEYSHSSQSFRQHTCSSRSTIRPSIYGGTLVECVVVPVLDMQVSGSSRHIQTSVRGSSLPHGLSSPFTSWLSFYRRCVSAVSRKDAAQAWAWWPLWSTILWWSLGLKWLTSSPRQLTVSTQFQCSISGSWARYYSSMLWWLWSYVFSLGSSVKTQTWSKQERKNWKMNFNSKSSITM